MKRLKPILFIALSVCSLQGAMAQNIEGIKHFLDSTYAKAPIFANILISKGAKPIFEKSYGMADAVKHKPLTASNSFQIASISKQFTAYGIMLLANKGKIAYDEPVNKYLDKFPYANITVRHLLTHTSGLPDFWSTIRPNMDTTKANGNKEMYAYLLAHHLPLQFEPGTAWAYADIGYDMLAMIIEKLSGLSYTDYMQKNIFMPLKMKDTYAYTVTDIRKIKNPQLAYGHVYDAASKKFSYAHLANKYNFVYYLGGFYGDGSIVSTARDLDKWAEALKNCTLLPCDVQNVSIQPFTKDGKFPKTYPGNADMAYGFGWEIKQDSRLGKIASHGGGHPGNVHMVYRLLDKDITFIFLSNAETNNMQRITKRILEML